MASNRAFILAAARIDGIALRYADDELRKDRKIVLAAVRRSGNVVAELVTDCLKQIPPDSCDQISKYCSVFPCPSYIVLFSFSFFV